jgi:2-dehydro-3-deoxygluconokinase
VGFLRRYGVQTDHIQRGGERLGILFVEDGASQRPTKVVYDRKNTAFTSIKRGEIPWDEVFQDVDWFHFSGTAPALSADLVKAIQEACNRASDKNITISCDLNYRSALWSAKEAGRTMTNLLPSVDVLMCSRDGARIVFDLPENAEEAVRDLHTRFGLSHVAMTLRRTPSSTVNSYSALLYDGQVAHQSRDYRIHVVDRIGAGDAFAGALIYGLIDNKDSQETVEFAAAAACLKHTVPGDFSLITVDEVMALLREEKPDFMHGV